MSYRYIEQGYLVSVAAIVAPRQGPAATSGQLPTRLLWQRQPPVPHWILTVLSATCFREAQSDDRGEARANLNVDDTSPPTPPQPPSTVSYTHLTLPTKA